MFKEGPGKTRILAQTEEALYLKNANPRLKDIATLMLNTGMRPEEVCTCKGENVNLKERFIFVPKGKTRFARRTIPLTPDAYKVLKRRYRKGYLSPHKFDPNRPMVVCKSHRPLVDKLELDFRLYDLRHTFGSRMAMAGVDLPTLKELMGHSSITLTMRYVHPTPEHKREAIDKLVAWNHPQNPPTVERVETRTSFVRL